MQRLCDNCHGVYKNKSSFEAHQNKTGHRQNTIPNLEDSSNLTTEIARLQDLLEDKVTNMAILNDEIAQLSSLEHEKDIVRTTLKKLTKEQYDLIGKQLGFVKQPTPQPTTNAPVEDNKPPVHEPEFYIGKKEGDGWEYREFLGLSVKY